MKAQSKEEKKQTEKQNSTASVALQAFSCLLYVVWH